ncbi:VWA domain-containing protein [Virgibacillus sp. 179-BFC.A HS]|uniref:VWA domain-containing protein n=1 Tax=Tigheibacillus jepli TaxID=3035914 RepID=A0ABU5CF58_9BACI|nr:VWA domain-containing protein [Virgibacillus sp. 179-BFC.A HS]MDY0404955.1 VWA domain-containing protein [Virgibacillus sp. 179-BFC.A HS]
MDAFPAGDTAENYYYRTLALIAEDYRPYREFFNQVDTSYAENSAAPDEKAASPAKQPDTQVNVAVLFDASGSMGKQIGGKTQMDLAKEAVNDFLGQLPEGVQVSLRAYGHKGTGSDADKAMSCKSSEEVYPLGTYDSQKMKKALNTFSPAGWTPLAASIRAAGKDLKKQTGDNVENIVYVVSDGVETCGGDPVKEAKALNQSDIQAVVNIIGFDVDDAGQKALKKVAEAGKGKYATVRTKQELENFFIKARTDLINEWYSWENSNVNEIYKSQNERVNKLYKMENDMVNKAYTEENRLRELSYYLAEKFDTEDVTVRQKARTRGLDLRRYARHTALDFRQTLRNKGLDNRNDIRKKSRQARDKIRNEDKK